MIWNCRSLWARRAKQSQSARYASRTAERWRVKQSQLRSGPSARSEGRARQTNPIRLPPTAAWRGTDGAKQSQSAHSVAVRAGPEPAEGPSGDDALRRHYKRGSQRAKQSQSAWRGPGRWAIDRGHVPNKANRPASEVAYGAQARSATRLPVVVHQTNPIGTSAGGPKSLSEQRALGVGSHKCLHIIDLGVSPHRTFHSICGKTIND